MNNEKKTRLAALVGALGAVLLLVQSGRLPEVKSWLSEKRSRRYETADRISAYLTRKAIPWDRRTVSGCASAAFILHGDGDVCLRAAFKKADG